MRESSLAREKAAANERKLAALKKGHKPPLGKTSLTGTRAKPATALQKQPATQAIRPYLPGSASRTTRTLPALDFRLSAISPPPVLMHHTALLIPGCVVEDQYQTAPSFPNAGS